MRKIFLIVCIILLSQSVQGALVAADFPDNYRYYPDSFIAYAQINNTTRYPIHYNSSTYISRLASLNGGTSPGVSVYTGFPINIINYTACTAPNGCYNQYVTVRSDSGCQARLPPIGYAGLFPIPSNVTYETGSSDRVMNIVDVNLKRTWTVYATSNTSMTAWTSCGQYSWDQTDMTTRPQGYTSVSSSGMDVSPLIIRIEELNSGTINHALALLPGTATGASGLGRGWVYPAVHQSDWSSVCGSNCLQNGQRFRLNASFNEAPYASDAKKIAIIRALKTYGAILVDNQGNPGFISIWAEKTDAWQPGYAWINSIKASDFEVINQNAYVIGCTNYDIRGYCIAASTWQVTQFDQGVVTPDPPYVDPLATFIPDNLSGTHPLAVQFTDYSYDDPNNVTYRVWAFKNVIGNNTWTQFSTEETPQYTFTEPGNYTVNLTAGNEYGYNITPHSVWVNVSTPSSTLVAIVYNHLQQFFLLGRLL